MSHYECVKFECNEKRIRSVSLYSISLSIIRDMFFDIEAIYFNFSITFSLNILF